MLCFFGEKKFLSANLLEKTFLSLKWAEKNILLALCALKIIVFGEAKKNILTPKKIIAPPPLSKMDIPLVKPSRHFIRDNLYLFGLILLSKFGLIFKKLK